MNWRNWLVILIVILAIVMCVVGIYYSEGEFDGHKYTIWVGEEHYQCNVCSYSPERLEISGCAGEIDTLIFLNPANVRIIENR